MSEDYRLFVSRDRCTLVRIWMTGGREQVEVAYRPSPGAVWSPPVIVQEEK